MQYIQCAKTCKNVHLKYLLTKKRASQGLIYQKTCKNVQKTCKNVQKRASQMFLDPIQKRALSRSVHLEVVYLESLLYLNWKTHLERKTHIERKTLKVTVTKLQFNRVWSKVVSVSRVVSE